ncbi:MAG: 1-aminocyclopropane-1-carboxylate deaminase, partial [Pseudomonas sp.]
LAWKKQIEAGRIAPGMRLVLGHTGGLQGRRGFTA